MTTATVYAEFAARETRGLSPSYERLSIAVSRDDAMLCLLGRPPPAKRQPNLLLTVADDPPLLVRGDPVDDLPALAAQVSAEATLVVFHTQATERRHSVHRPDAPGYDALRSP